MSYLFVERRVIDYFESSGLLWTSTARHHRFNRYLRRLLGLSEEDLGLSNQEILTVVHTDDHDSPVLSAKTAPDAFREWRIRLLRKNGDVLIFRVVTVPTFCSETGTVVRILRNISAETQQARFLSLAQFALEKGLDPVVWVDQGGTIVFANGRFTDLVEQSRSSVIGGRIEQYLHFGDLLGWDERLGLLKANGSRMSLAGVVPFESAVIPVEVAENYLVQDRVVRITYTLRDLRERKDLETRIAEVERLTSSMLELMPLPVAIVDRESGEILDTNNAAAEILGRTRADIIGRTTTDFVLVDEHRSGFLAELDAKGRVERYEIQINTRSSGDRWMLVSGQLIPGNDGGTILATFVEVSAHKRLEEELRRLATVDALTGCLNRRSFIERGTEELGRSKREGTALGVLAMDLDHFKRINDSRGHAAGDVALARFSETCRQVLRTHDVFGRIGGEEFGVILPSTDPRSAQTVAERIRRRVEALDLEYDRRRFSMTVSIGIAPAVVDDSSIDEILERADRALYKAKTEGRNRSCLWEG